MRPWTLNKKDADHNVPHLLQLAQIPQEVGHRSSPKPVAANLAGNGFVAGFAPGVFGKRLRRKTPASEYTVKSKVYTASADSSEAPQQAVMVSQECACSWRAAWQWYIQGHVVSEHACRVISNFLTNTLGKGAACDDSSEEEEDEAGTRESHHVTPLRPSLDMLHAILRERHGDGDEGKRSNRAKQEQARTIKRTRAMWESECVQGGGDTGAVDTSGDKPTLKVKEYGKAARALGKEVANETPMPFSGQTEPMVSIYGTSHSSTVKDWLRGLMEERLEITLPLQGVAQEFVCLDFSGEGDAHLCRICSTDCGFARDWNGRRREQRLKKGDQLVAINGRPVVSSAALVAAVAGNYSTLVFKRACPNEEQYAVLAHVAHRVEHEWFEERAGTVEASNDDPLFDLVHGLPGTGKSRVIRAAVAHGFINPWFGILWF